VTVTDNAGNSDVVDGIVNAVERADTIELTGQTEAGATVAVTVGGTLLATVTADADGVWPTDYDGTEIPTDAEGHVAVKVVAEDDAGNTDTATTTIQYDTYVNSLAFTSGTIEGDDVVNKAEASDGVTLTGVVEKGSTVVVSFGGVNEEATVDANGNWTVTFSEASIETAASGQADLFTTDIVVNATDEAGNVKSISDTVEVDLVAPDAVDFRGEFTENDTVTSVKLGSPTPNATFAQFEAGADTAQAVNVSDVDKTSEDFEFAADSAVPNGSHLIVTNNDDAGNSTSTLVVLQDADAAVFDLGAGALSDFNIAEINLEVTDGVNLDITAEQLRALSADSDRLVIHGDANDSVTMAELVDVEKSGTETIDNQQYNVYDLGDDTSLVIDSEIQLNPVI